MRFRNVLLVFVLAIGGVCPLLAQQQTTVLHHVYRNIRLELSNLWAAFLDEPNGSLGSEAETQVDPTNKFL
jgi:hypothetical protein